MNLKRLFLTAMVAAACVLSACGTPAAPSSGDAAFAPSSGDAAFAPSSGDAVSSPSDVSESISTPEEEDAGESSADDTEEEKEEYTPPEVLLGNYFFSIDGTTVTLPLKTSEFLALGFVPEEGKYDAVCQPDDMIYDLDGAFNGFPLSCYTKNFTDKEVDFKDSYLTWVKFDDRYLPDEEKREIILPGGLKLWESTLEEVVALYGEPETINDTLYEWEYYYDAESDYHTEPETDCSLNLYFSKEEPFLLTGFILNAEKPVS